MFSAIKNWWNKKDIQQEIFNERMSQLEKQLTEQGTSIHRTSEALIAVEVELEKAEEELAVHRTKAAIDAERYTSVEPWIEIKSDRIDPIKGLVVEMDWNDAFIQHLKENGFNTKDENIAVQKYIACLYEDVINKMEEQSIDNSDKKPKVSDFV